MQAKYPFYGYKRHGPGGSALLTAALLLMLAAPLALAGPRCDKFPDHPSCAGFSAVDIDAWYVYYDGLDFHDMEAALPWNGPYYPGGPNGEHHLWYWDDMPGWDDFEENTLADIPRRCGIGGTGEFPPYICNDPDYRGGRIYIDMSAVTSNWRFTGKKKDIREYCNFLDAWSSNPDLPTFGGQPLTFGVTWSAVIFAEDTCEEGVGNCPIGAGIHSLRPGLNQLTDLYNKTGFDLPDVDQITVHAGIGFDHEPIDFPVGFPDTESNPFTLPQALPLETIEIFFVAGSKRSSCEADVAENTLWLVTEPVE